MELNVLLGDIKDNTINSATSEQFSNIPHSDSNNSDLSGQLYNALIDRYTSKEKQSIMRLLTSNSPDGTMLYERDKRDPEGEQNGGHYYLQVKNSAAYTDNVIAPEVALYKKNAAEISKLIASYAPERIIDMGGGDGAKTIAMLEAFAPSVISGMNITTKDISAYLGITYKKSLEARATKTQRNIKTGFIHESFFDATELQSNNDRKMYLIDTSIFGNRDDDEIIAILKTIKANKLFSQTLSFANVNLAPNKNSPSYTDTVNRLKGTYGDPDVSNPYYNEQAHRATESWFIESLAYRLGDSIRDKIAYTLIYEDDGDKGGRILGGVVVTKPFSVTLDGVEIHKEIGDRIWLNQSRKRTPEEVEDLVRKSGKQGGFLDKNDDCGVLFLLTNQFKQSEHAPKQQRLIKKMRNALLGTLLLIGTAATTSHFYNKREKSKSNAKARLERAKRNLPYVERNDIYGGMGGLPSKNAIMDRALQERDRYDEYTSQKLRLAYNLSDDKIQEIKEPFLTWKQKNQHRYMTATQASDGDPTIYMLNDFINEIGDVFSLSQDDFMSYIKKHNGARQNTFYAQIAAKDDVFDVTNDNVQDITKLPADIVTFIHGQPGMEVGYVKLPSLGHPIADQVRDKYVAGGYFLVAKDASEKYFSLTRGKEVINTYYDNYPGVHPFANGIVKKYDVDDYHLQPNVEQQLSNLLKQGYTFDYYVLSGKGNTNEYNSYYIDYFMKTFLNIPDSMCNKKPWRTTGKVKAEDYNFMPRLNECITHLQQGSDTAFHSLREQDKNALKSIIFSKIYVNSDFYGHTKKDFQAVIASVQEDINKYMQHRQEHGPKDESKRELNFHGLGIKQKN